LDESGEDENERYDRSNDFSWFDMEGVDSVLKWLGKWAERLKKPEELTVRAPWQLLEDTSNTLEME